MMKRFVLALIALVVTALPGFAADDAAPGMHPGMHAPMQADRPMLQPDPEMHQMHQKMMQNPKHMLAMAYHKNLMTFGLALQKVAQQGETIPRDFARATITEMRRSADQMDIYHEEAARSLPADLKAQHAEMAKKMGAHLNEMRTQLVQLEGLAKGERVDSREVLKHLEILLKGCEGMCREAGMCHQGMHGEGGCAKGKDCGCEKGKGMDGGCQQGNRKDCGCRDARKMQGKGREGCAELMRADPEMMQGRLKMMEEMKARDAEIAQLVDKMNNAPNDLKQAVIADILTKMVKQRAEMSAYMEKTQQHIMHHHHMDGASLSSSMKEPCGADEDSEDADLNDGASDGVNSDDMDSDDSDSESGDMNMKDMNMKDMNMKDMK
jgi:hypothetical protein